MRTYIWLIILITLASIILNSAFSAGVGGNVFVPNGIVSVSIAPTSDSFIAGNSETWTATVIPGTPPYSYTWNVYYYNGLFLATTTYSSNSYSTNSYSYQFNLGQTYYANVVVVDNIPNTASSANSVITVCYPTCSGSGSGGSPILFNPTIQVKSNINTGAIAAVGLAIFFGLVAIGYTYYNYGNKNKS